MNKKRIADPHTLYTLFYMSDGLVEEGATVSGAKVAEAIKRELKDRDLLEGVIGGPSDYQLFIYQGELGGDLTFVEVV